MSANVHDLFQGYRTIENCNVSRSESARSCYVEIVQIHTTWNLRPSLEFAGVGAATTTLQL